MLEGGKIEVGKAIIKNNSKINLDLTELSKPSTILIEPSTSFLIYHTHTSETYVIPNDLYTENYRTQDENYNVLAVGDALKMKLKEKGFEAVQNRTVHDYPSYNGSYSASYQTVEKELQKSHYDVLFDIHRDAVSSTSHYRLATQINNENVAKLMFVVGSNGSGLSHHNWMENLKLAILIQNKAEEMYPGLFREITLSNSRYNQQLSTGSLIIEVGGTGNTMEEAQNAMKYFAEVLDAMKGR